MTCFRALAMMALLPLSTVWAQDDSQSVDCSEFQATVQLAKRMTMSYVVTLDEEDEVNGQIAIRLVCECQAWVSLAVSEDQFMPNSDAIVGLPLDNEVVKYKMTDYSMSEKDRLGESAQTLSNTNVMSNETHTVLEFVKRLIEPNEIPIDARGTNSFLWAHGFGLPLGIHLSNARGAFTLELSPCNEGQRLVGGSGDITTIETESYQAQWSAHGLLSSVAWGILAPCAIGSSLLRDYIPGKGLWFKIHMWLNATVLLFTIVAFAVAVTVIGKARDPQHFQGGAHRSVGLAIFLLVIIQVFGGLFRPHPTNKGEKKEPIRLVWELMHKGSGIGLLGLSWWEVHEGIRLYYTRFAGTDYRAVFWGITGAIAGIVLVLWIYSKLSGIEEEPDKAPDFTEGAQDESEA